MKTIKTNASLLKTLVVDYKKELALIIGGTAVAVTALVVLRAFDEADEHLKDPAVVDAWNTILSS